MNKNLKIFIAILIAIALGIGIAIVKNRSKIENGTHNNNNISNDTNNTISANISNNNTTNNISNKPKENQIITNDVDISGQTSIVPSTILPDDINKIENGNSHTFIGKIIAINDEAIIIKPNDGYKGVSGNQITLKKYEYGANLKLNDKVEITFTGTITKSYPGNIHVVKIKKL